MKRKALFEVPLKWLALFGEIQKHFCFYNSLYQYVKARRYVKIMKISVTFLKYALTCEVIKFYLIKYPCVEVIQES